MDIAEQVKMAEAGDKEALIRLVTDKKDEYYKLAYVYMQDREDAMDAVQDMIIILYDNIKKLKNPDAFYSWSKTILVNCCRNLLKRRNRVVLLEKYEDGEYTEDYQGREQKHDIMKGLQRLNIYQQEAIKLKYFLDMDYETISKIAGVPLGTVKSRISEGLRKLRKVFGGEYL